MNHKEKRLINQRILGFVLIEMTLGIIVLLRLAYLQIFKFSHYQLLSDKNRLVTERLLPIRGQIMDSSGNVLASNKFSYSAVLDTSELSEEEKNKIITKLKIEEVQENRNKQILLQENLDWETLAKYYVASISIPEITIGKTRTREYSYPQEFSHIIGYTGSPTKYDIDTTGNTALTLPMAKIGKNCIEKMYNEELFGKTGLQVAEVNSRRKFVRIIEHTDSIAGQDIKLTINLDLQLEIYNILSEYESGSCVVMDVNTGAVLSFVSYPGYDINIFTRKIGKEALEELYKDPYKPMINKASTGLYAPGSAFKLITALAGLHYGVIDQHTRFHCSGVHEIGNYKFHCWKWKYGGHGSIGLVDAIAESCDIYFYNIALLLGPDKIAKVAKDFGLGIKTGIDLPHEKSGLIPTKSWKKKNKKQSWTKGDSLNMAIGQGFNLTTPLQLARMLSILINGLNLIVPHIRADRPLSPTKKLKYKSEHIELIMDGMNAVVNSDSGTARTSAIEEEDFQMGGKTGSSQVYHITEAQRRLGQTVSDNYWMKEHSVFVGYAPVDDPKYAVVVLIEHGGGGAKVAAPIAKDVLITTKKLCQN